MYSTYVTVVVVVVVVVVDVANFVLLTWGLMNDVEHFRSTTYDYRV